MVLRLIVNKTYGIKPGKLTKWARWKGYICAFKTDVTKEGEKYFKYYLANGYNCVGVTEEGLKLIADNLDEINK